MLEAFEQSGSLPRRPHGTPRQTGLLPVRNLHSETVDGVREPLVRGDDTVTRQHHVAGAVRSPHRAGAGAGMVDVHGLVVGALQADVVVLRRACDEPAILPGAVLDDVPKLVEVGRPDVVDNAILLQAKPDDATAQVEPAILEVHLHLSHDAGLAGEVRHDRTPALVRRRVGLDPAGSGVLELPCVHGLRQRTTDSVDDVL